MPRLRAFAAGDLLYGSKPFRWFGEYMSNPVLIRVLKKGPGGITIRFLGLQVNDLWFVPAVPVERVLSIHFDDREYRKAREDEFPEVFATPTTEEAASSPAIPDAKTTCTIDPRPPEIRRQDIILLRLSSNGDVTTMTDRELARVGVLSGLRFEVVPGELGVKVSFRPRRFMTDTPIGVVITEMEHRGEAFWAFLRKQLEETPPAEPGSLVAATCPNCGPVQVRPDRYEVTDWTENMPDAEIRARGRLLGGRCRECFEEAAV